MNPAAIKAAICALVLGVTFGAGWMVNGWRLNSHTAKAEVKAVQHEVVHEQAVSQATAAVSASAAAVAVQTQTVYRTINHEVIRYVQSPAPVCTLDPDWVRIYNAAATASIPDPASGGDAASAPNAGDAPNADHGQQNGAHGDGGQLPHVQADPGQVG